MRVLKANDRQVASATHVASASETEYRIAGERGLVLIVRRPRQDGTSTRGWQFRSSKVIDGKQVRSRVVIGEYPNVTLGEAIAEAARLRAQVLGGETPVLKKHAAKGTLSELVGEYETVRRGHLVRLDETLRVLRRNVLPELGTRKAASITQADIDRVARDEVAKSAGATTLAHQIASAVREVYSYVLNEWPSAAQRYGIAANPAMGLGGRRQGIYSKPKARERHLDDDEITLLWTALMASEMRPLTRIAIQLVLVTAQRPGEVRREARAQVRLDRREWIIPTVHTKNRKASHHVPLSPLAVKLWQAALGQQDEKDANIFVDRHGEVINKVVMPSALANVWRTALVGHEPCTVHDLRRTAATGMRRLGVDRDVVSAILNHSPKGVTAIHYDKHDLLPEMRAALEKWARHLKKIKCSLT